MSAPVATCPRDGAPVIATLAFRKAEFYCLECGGHFGFLEPRGVEETPELVARYDALRAEWEAHAGAKLITDGAWYSDCPKCITGDPTRQHAAHATDEEVEAHEAALAWLEQRAHAT